jgi:YhcH/YjgK/YiaL family protein
MIIDKIENADVYKNLDEDIYKALDYLVKTDFSNIEKGRYNIDGDLIYALVNEYQTKDESKGKLESHKKYLDVQFVAKGSELIGYAPFINQEIAVPYKDENDIVFYEGEKSYTRLDTGMFAILFPQDLHMPGIKIDDPQDVKKVVVKVKYSK